MARKRAENREGSLGFPGYVKPVFIKESKPPMEKEKITRAPRERKTRTHLKKFLFMDDNAPCHRTVAAEQLLESEDIECMDWPARSPDLNPIEHVWDFLGRRLAARTLPPVTIRELRLAFQDEWAEMPQQLIDNLILSMGRRCETCLAVRGDHIPY
ncbi:transposable element Tc3 transposase [Trichonephila clavipes]|nr:transposable element Tc3 transposase [Trichonephila clavipes]